eukprot:6194545-Pleurochrysis_carterae.AAC.1
MQHASPPEGTPLRLAGDAEHRVLEIGIRREKLRNLDLGDSELALVAVKKSYEDDAVAPPVRRQRVDQTVAQRRANRRVQRLREPEVELLVGDQLERARRADLVAAEEIDR